MFWLYVDFWITADCWEMRCIVARTAACWVIVDAQWNSWSGIHAAIVSVHGRQRAASPGDLDHCLSTTGLEPWAAHGFCSAPRPRAFQNSLLPNERWPHLWVDFCGMVPPHYYQIYLQINMTVTLSRTARQFDQTIELNKAVWYHVFCYYHRITVACRILSATMEDRLTLLLTVSSGYRDSTVITENMLRPTLIVYHLFIFFLSYWV